MFNKQTSFCRAGFFAIVVHCANVFSPSANAPNYCAQFFTKSLRSGPTIF
jgi:hypothetical protein